MHRKRWTNILVEYGHDEASAMAAEIQENHTVEIISPPQEALAMIKMRETAQNTLFYAGEVLITETKVRVNGEPGIGMIKGYQPERSLALAIIDAAFSAGLREVDSWIPKLEALEQLGEAKWLKKQRELAKTKVSFETMAEE